MAHTPLPSKRQEARQEHQGSSRRRLQAEETEVPSAALVTACPQGTPPAARPRVAQGPRKARPPPRPRPRPGRAHTASQSGPAPAPGPPFPDALGLGEPPRAGAWEKQVSSPHPDGWAEASDIRRSRRQHLPSRAPPGGPCRADTCWAPWTPTGSGSPHLAPPRRPPPQSEMAPPLPGQPPLPARSRHSRRRDASGGKLRGDVLGTCSGSHALDLLQGETPSDGSRRKRFREARNGARLSVPSSKRPLVQRRFS